jgi:hypothetical protein
MVSRKELEGLVALAIREIHTAEANLERQYRSLAKAGIRERFSFVRSLNELDGRVSQLEQLVGQFESPTAELTAA